MKCASWVKKSHANITCCLCVTMFIPSRCKGSEARLVVALLCCDCSTADVLSAAAGSNHLICSHIWLQDFSRTMNAPTSSGASQNSDPSLPARVYFRTVCNYNCHVPLTSDPPNPLRGLAGISLSCFKLKLERKPFLAFRPANQFMIPKLKQKRIHPYNASGTPPSH